LLSCVYEDCSALASALVAAMRSSALICASILYFFYNELALGFGFRIANALLKIVSNISYTDP
jgi:hypothetical protein